MFSGGGSRPCLVIGSGQVRWLWHSRGAMMVVWGWTLDWAADAAASALTSATVPGTLPTMLCMALSQRQAALLQIIEMQHT